MNNNIPIIAMARTETLAQRARELAAYDRAERVGPSPLVTGRYLVDQKHERDMVITPLRKIDLDTAEGGRLAHEDYKIVTEFRRGLGLALLKTIVNFQRRRGRTDTIQARMLELNERRRSGDTSVAVYSAKGKVQR